MIGITIGVFSVISVMTAIGALQYSIENGISFLGSNIFQFAKYPANVSASGDVQREISKPAQHQLPAGAALLSVDGRRGARDLSEKFRVRSERTGGL